MAQISADTVELNRRGGEVVSAAERIKADLETVRSNTNPAEIFVGRASDSYQTAYDEWHNAQTKMLESLEKLGQWLRDAATAIETHDKELGDSLGIGG